MRRIFPDFAYGPGPRDNCWWDETCAAPAWPVLEGETEADVGIVGGGFTGMSAALHLAEAGVKVVVLEAETPGWGASGRNGGFCCMGGGKLGDAAIDRRWGTGAARAYRAAEVEAVELVRALLDRLGIEADTHSRGETLLAHTPRHWEVMRREAEAARARGEDVEIVGPDDLAAHGMGGPFHGAVTTPVGFGLNPRKYLFGLAAGAARAGGAAYQGSPVTKLARYGGRWRLTTPAGRLTCETVLICTNGYSSEDLPDWLAGRYMPAQSTVLVTRPLTQAEREAQGWTTDQIAYDSRELLHYFRLMPDGRFLFGMRGGLFSKPRAEARARARTRADFEAMFPAWAGVEHTHCWSGFVALARDLMPYAGPVPDCPGLFAGLCYHGNGVAMGSYTGKLLAGLAQGRDKMPAAMKGPMRRFPLGRFRRLLMPPAYALRALADR